MKNEQTGAGVAEPPTGPGDEFGEARRGAETAGAGVAPGAGAEQGPPQQQGPPRGVIREYFESLVVTAIMALFGMTFVVQAVKVPTGSMQNTILIGDHLLVNKFIFAPGPPAFFLPQREIRRGDIVVFKYPGKSPDPQFERHFIDDTRPDNLPFQTNYVKRVVGLPGDVVEVRGNEVLINGQPLDERRVAAANPPDEDDERTDGDESKAPLAPAQGVAPVGEGQYDVYWRPERFRATRPRDAGEKFAVPEGHYFVMGDNRENSQDSRYWGYVQRDLVVGRALFVYWSYDESAPSTGNFLQDFFVNTRWSRTGTLVR
jgi:signal peptidase I